MRLVIEPGAAMSRKKVADAAGGPAGEGAGAGGPAPVEKFTEPVKLRLSWKMRLQLVATAKRIDMGQLLEDLCGDRLEVEYQRTILGRADPAEPAAGSGPPPPPPPRPKGRG